VWNKISCYISIKLIRRTKQNKLHFARQDGHLSVKQV